MFVIVEAIDLQLVKALPVHIQRAFGAGDLPEHAEDPPGGDARGLNHPRGAAVEIDQALNLIVIFHFPPLGIGRDPAGIPGIGLRHRTLAQAGLRAGGHFTDPAQQKLGDGQGMGAEVAKRPAAAEGFRAAPGPGQVRVVIKPLIKGAAKAHRFANIAPGDNLLCQQRRRRFDVVKGHHGLHPRAPCRLRHLLRLLLIDRQRLLAIDMFTRRDRRHRHCVVQMVRRGDIHHINLRIVYQLAPVAVGLFRPQFRRVAFGHRLILIRQRVEMRALGQIGIEHRRATVSVSVCLPHKT